MMETKSEGGKRWLTVPEAAVELGISESTVRTRCNARPPAIEHKREGSRGRKKRGTILIDRAVIEAHNARHSYRAAPIKVELAPVRRQRRKIFSPHLNREIEVIDAPVRHAAEGYSGALSP